MSFAGFPHDPKVHFQERPTSVPVFANRKKFGEDFCFYKKRQKEKLCLFCSKLSETAHIPSSESGAAKLVFWELHSASQHRTTTALNRVCEPLCFISIYFSWLFFGSVNTQKCFPYKLMETVSLLYTVSAYEMLHRNAVLSNSGGNVYLIIKLKEKE